MTNGDQFSDSQLKWGYWYITHREQLVKAATIALFIVCIASWGFSLIRLGYLLLVEEPRTQAAVAGLPEDLVHVREHLRPLEDIQILTVEVLPYADGRADFYAHVQNPNPEYAVLSFQYSFAHDGGETQKQTGYLLPGGDMYLYALGIEGASTARNPQLVIDPATLSWKRILGWEARRTAMLDLPVTDVAVNPIADGSRSGSIVSFVLTNNTSYSFWTIDVPVLFLRGSRVAGINAIRLERLQSGERRPVTLQWFDAPQGATVVRVVPYVNVFDPAVLQTVRGGTQRF